MEDDLSRFLEEAAGWSHDWGVHDCLLLIADWAVWARDVDPAAPWRGRYRTAIGAARIINRAGGLMSLLDDGLAAAGMARVDASAARTGDVGLVERLTPRGPGLVGGLACADVWATLGPRGLVIAPAAVSAAWRLT